MYTRDETKVVHIGNVAIGGGNPIRVQSMCNTHTADVRATVGQILQLEEAGCELVRVTVPDQDSADALTEIKKQIHIPLIADIHFDWRMAVEAMKHGADKIRINPGNIGTKEDLSKVIDEAKARQEALRFEVETAIFAYEQYERYSVPGKQIHQYRAGDHCSPLQ